MQATNRSVTLETHLHSVKAEKCSFMQGMWDVAMTKLPKVLNCCDMDSISQSLKKRSAGKESAASLNHGLLEIVSCVLCFMFVIYIDMFMFRFSQCGDATDHSAPRCSVTMNI